MQQKQRATQSLASLEAIGPPAPSALGGWSALPSGAILCRLASFFPSRSPGGERTTEPKIPPRARVVFKRTNEAPRRRRTDDGRLHARRRLAGARWNVLHHHRDGGHGPSCRFGRPRSPPRTSLLLNGRDRRSRRRLPAPKPRGCAGRRAHTGPPRGCSRCSGRPRRPRRPGCTWCRLPRSNGAAVRSASARLGSGG